MKLHYFAQPAPDTDDRALAQAVEAGLVPRGCLLGGAVLAELLRATTAPCAACRGGPRERCGGAPYAQEAPNAADLARLKNLLDAYNWRDPK